MGTRDIDIIVRARDETAAGIHSAAARMRAMEGEVFGVHAPQRRDWSAAIGGQFEQRAELEDRLFRATHTRLEVSLAEHDAYYAGVRSKHAANADMLARIDTTSAAERKRIMVEGGEGVKGRGGILESQMLDLGIRTALVVRAYAGAANLLSASLKGGEHEAEAVADAIEKLPFGIGAATKATVNLWNAIWKISTLEDIQAAKAKSEGIAAGGRAIANLERSQKLREELDLAPDAASRRAIQLRQQYDELKTSIADLGRAQAENMPNSAMLDPVYKAAQAAYAADKKALEKEEGREKAKLAYDVEAAETKANLKGHEQKMALLEMEHRKRVEDAKYQGTYDAAAEKRLHGAEKKALEEEESQRKKRMAYEVEGVEIQASLKGHAEKMALLEMEHRKRIDDAKAEGTYDKPTEDRRYAAEKAKDAEDLAEQNKKLIYERVEAEIRADLKGHNAKMALMALQARINREEAKKAGLDMAVFDRMQRAKWREAAEAEPHAIAAIERGFLTRAPGSFQADPTLAETAKNTSAGVKEAQEGNKLLTEILAMLRLPGNLAVASL